MLHQTADTGLALECSLTAALPPLVPGQGGIPPYPTATLVPSPVIPSPPKIPADLPEREAIDWLMTAYRGAVTARYPGKRCYVFAKRGSLDKSQRALSLLTNAARAMREYEVAPAAWVAWRVDLWREKHTNHPPLPYVFGAKSIEEKHGWFGKECEAYMGGRVVPTETAQVVRRRWALMWRRLNCLRDRSPESVRAEVARHFAEGEYDQLIQAARAEAVDAQANLNAQAQRGRWIGWG